MNAACRSFGTLFSGVVADDFELAGQDIGENFDDVAANEECTMAEKVVLDGGVEVAAHVCLCVLTGGCYEVHRICGPGR
jgi:hypothetical protein